MKKVPEVLGLPISVDVVKKVKCAKTAYDELIFKLEKRLIDVAKEIFATTSNVSSVQKMTLTSVIKDWCESIDNTAFEELYNDGTDKCLALFKTVSNDESGLVNRLAQMATDLRIEDWDDKTITRYIESLNKWKSTAENHQSKSENRSGENGDFAPDTYEITFVDEAGSATTKRFKKTEPTKRGQLLRNQITSAVDAMGQAISDQEKRQILMDILKSMC